MLRLIGFRVSLTVITASALTLFLSELHIARALFPDIPPIVVNLVVLIVGGLSADLVAKLILRMRWLRRAIMGSTYVEGYWLILTYSPQGNDLYCPFSLPGILSIRYLIDKNEIHIVSNRLAEDGENTSTTESQMAYIAERGTFLRYLNFFSINIDGQLQYGLAEGIFSRTDPVLLSPDLLQSTVWVYSDNKLRKQISRRISDNDVKWLSERFGKGRWIAPFLAVEGQTISQRIAKLRNMGT